MKFLSTLRTVLVLGRVSNLPTIWTNVAVGWFLSGGGWVIELAWITLGMSLVYAAGMTLNDAFDAAWDRKHAVSRPIPSGRVGLGAVWTLGLMEMLAGLVIVAGLTTVHPFFTGLLVFAVFFYNWLHKRWAGSVLIMGACRALVYLGAGSAVVAHTSTIEVPSLVFIIAGSVVIYITGLTIAARREHLLSAPEPNFPVRLMLMLPVLFPLLAFRSVPETHVTYALAAVGLIGVWSWLVLMRRALREKIPKGIAYAIAGIAFYDAAIVVFADWRAAVFCLACFVLTLGGQRFIPAT